MVSAKVVVVLKTNPALPKEHQSLVHLDSIQRSARNEGKLSSQKLLLFIPQSWRFSTSKLSTKKFLLPLKGFFSKNVGLCLAERICTLYSDTATEVSRRVKVISWHYLPTFS